MKQLLLTGLIIIGLSQVLSADVIVLKSGKVIEGKIIKESQYYVRMETDQDVTVQEFLKTQIESIETDDEVRVMSSSNSKKEGAGQEAEEVEESVSRKKKDGEKIFRFDQEYDISGQPKK